MQAITSVQLNLPNDSAPHTIKFFNAFVEFVKASIDHPQPQSQLQPQLKTRAWKVEEEWTADRLLKSKDLASEIPVAAFIAERTCQGGTLSASEVRDALGLTKAQMNAQLGWFSKRIIKEIAPHWKATKWNWPFSPYFRKDERYSMPAWIAEIWNSGGTDDSSK